MDKMDGGCVGWMVARVNVGCVGWMQWMDALGGWMRGCVGWMDERMRWIGRWRELLNLKRKETRINWGKTKLN
jgi:hypothetical protein